MINKVIMTTAATSSFDTHFIELDTSKMICTGEESYAICNHHFPSNWRSVSINGDEATITTKDKQVLVKSRSSLSDTEKKSIEDIRKNLKEVVTKGPFNVKSKNGFCRLTIFDKNGGQSSMGVGGSNSSASSASSTKGMSVSRTGKNSYIVWKQDFPFNWQRLFINEDVVTAVFKDGRVIMMPQDLMKSDEREKISEIRKEVEKLPEGASKMSHGMMDSIKNPFEFVNKALGGLFG